MDLTQLKSTIVNNVSNVGVDIVFKILAAIAFWVIGGWLIRVASAVLNRALSMKHVDSTIAGYVTSAAQALLKLVLVVAIMGYFGVQTTTFAALLAGVGLAIGAAWGGLLANFAAGIFLVVLRPFSRGDFISAAGVTGTVSEIGLFVTAINTPDNVRTFVGNNKLFSENIQNFSANAYRRVDLTAQLAHGADHGKAIATLKATLATIPNVCQTPAPDVEILEFTASGPVLAVRPYTHTDHYWQVYFATNVAIREELGRLGFAVAETHHVVRKVG